MFVSVAAISMAKSPHLELKLLRAEIRLITAAVLIHPQSAPAEGQQQQLKTTSDVTSKFPLSALCCRASVL